MHIEKRATPSRRLQLAAPLLAIAFTLLVSSLLVAWAGAPVGKAYALLLEGGFGSTFAWSETLTRATPLILTGLSAAVAFRARLPSFKNCRMANRYWVFLNVGAVLSAASIHCISSDTAADV